MVQCGKKKLSIIVPCYNVEEYVEKCLLSLEDQDVPKTEYEVLVYNDGSKDNTLSVVEKIAENYSNVVVKTHPNKGLSGTRNRGINEAQGDFVWFVDSDDWIDNNCLSEILHFLKPNTDLLAFPYLIKEGQWKKKEEKKSIGKLPLRDFLIMYSSDTAPLYIFKKEFLINNQLFFKEGIKHEDTLFFPKVLGKVGPIQYYNKPVYHYLLRENSITTATDIKRVKDLAYIIDSLYNDCILLPSNYFKYAFENRIAHRITEMLNYGVDNGKEGEDLINCIMCEHPEYWQIMRDAIDLKPKILYWAVKLSPFSFVTTYRFLSKLR